MNSLYMRLAGQNIKKHRRSYVPYMLTGILTAAVYYILHSLATNPDVGETASAMLNLASSSSWSSPSSSCFTRTAS